MTIARIVLVAITAYAGTSASYAQWPQVKTPGIPRLPNGKPDLSAPAPRAADGHPDLSGVWDVGSMIYFHDLANALKPGDVQLTPWAAAVQKQRRDRNHVDDPYGYCLPLGVPRIDTRSPFKILQTPMLTAFLHESFVGMMFRQVFTDGRPLPKASEVDPTWLGYSVGRWKATRSWSKAQDSAIAAGSAPTWPIQTATHFTLSSDSSGPVWDTWTLLLQSTTPRLL